ncbi:hypothetical protein [Lactococcus garvieae]|uniref:hypothetical protein n=1 Tax=Lactococcus garvieae TaxID=1363 RepID=UPI00398F3579
MNKELPDVVNRDIDEKRVQLGYDSENIRKFIPKEKRRVDARRKRSHLREQQLMAG